MPWCDDCERFLTPNSLRADGRCPTCGLVLANPSSDVDGEAAAAEDYKAPWHFKLMIVAVVGYLGWRAYQIIEGLFT